MMSEGIFGWWYPAGCENDPNAPWNREEPTCNHCGLDEEDCECEDRERSEDDYSEDQAEAYRARREQQKLEGGERWASDRNTR